MRYRGVPASRISFGCSSSPMDRVRSGVNAGRILPGGFEAPEGQCSLSVDICTPIVEDPKVDGQAPCPLLVLVGGKGHTKVPNRQNGREGQTAGLPADSTNLYPGDRTPGVFSGTRRAGDGLRLAQEGGIQRSRSTVPGLLYWSRPGSVVRISTSSSMVRPSRDRVDVTGPQIPDAGVVAV
jgi:hypothetical protein